MMNAQFALLLENPDPLLPQLRQVAEWWNQLRVSGDSGATTWEVLDDLERKVTDCITADPPDIARAVSLTMRAMHFVAGNENL